MVLSSYRQDMRSSLRDLNSMWAAPRPKTLNVRDVPDLVDDAGRCDHTLGLGDGRGLAGNDGRFSVAATPSSSAQSPQRRIRLRVRWKSHLDSKFLKPDVLRRSEGRDGVVEGER
jgi:hypothetical protein